MRAVVNTLCALSMITCVPQIPQIRPQLYAGELPPDVHLDLAGTFALSPTGELSLTLTAPCTALEFDDFGVPIRFPCRDFELNAVHVVASTPWGASVPGVWIDANRLVFRVTSNLDDVHVQDHRYVQDDLPALVTRPWAICGTTWSPSADEARQLLQLLDATNENFLVAGGPRPGLEVTKFEIDGGTLHAGGESTLTVQITNHGPGTAYRVIATVSSGIMSVHGRRLRFGLNPAVCRARS